MKKEQIQYMAAHNVNNLFGNLDEDGIAVWVQDGRIIIKDNQNTLEYPDTPGNREMCIMQAVEIIKEWQKEE